MTAPATLDFTAIDQRDAEWVDGDGTRYRFLDRSSGTGWHRWGYDRERDYNGWLFHGVMVWDGPFSRVPVTQEIGEDADWDEGWRVSCSCDEGDCGDCDPEC